MSFFNDYNRDQIYEEMDGSSNRGSKAGSIVSKLLSSVLILSIGFTSGSLYSTYQKNKSNTEGNTVKQPPVITTASTNNGTAYTLSHTDISGIVDKCADSVVEITIEAQSTIYGHYTIITLI